MCKAAIEVTEKFGKYHARWEGTKKRITSAPNWEQLILESQFKIARKLNCHPYSVIIEKISFPDAKSNIEANVSIGSRYSTVTFPGSTQQYRCFEVHPNQSMLNFLNGAVAKHYDLFPCAENLGRINIQYVEEQSA